ncbi:MAG: nitroreductase family protein [bacterium]
MNSSDSPIQPEASSTTSEATLGLLYERASVRAYLDRDIDPATLVAVLRAGVHAPTGGNLQPWSIIKIRQADVRRRLADMCEQPFIGAAPVNLLFCLDFRRLQRWAELEVAPFTGTASFRHFWIGFQDVIIAAQNICTAADAVGLGSVYIGTVLEFIPDLQKMFELPPGVCPVVLLVMGYPRVRPEPRPKLPVEVVVHDERYHEMEDRALLDAFEAKYPTRNNPERQMELTDERRERIAESCRQAHGEEFARKCLEYLDRQGYVRPVHRYFGLHYRGNKMPDSNDIFIQQLRECGFGCFDKWTPVGD